jgi:hypothetical protein
MIHTVYTMARLATGPLYAEELIVDFDDAGRIQRPNTERRWHDQEQVVLSACSIQLTLSTTGNSYCATFLLLCKGALDPESPRHLKWRSLALSILVQAYLSVLLRLDDSIDGYDSESLSPS